MVYGLLAPPRSFCIDIINFNIKKWCHLYSFKNPSCYSWAWKTLKIWNKTTMTCISNFPSLFFSLQPRPFSPPIHSSSPPPIAPLARAESTSSISSTNSLSAATTPTVGKNYLLSFNLFCGFDWLFLWSENPKALCFWLKLFCCVLLLPSDSSFKSTFSAKEAKYFNQAKKQLKILTPVFCRNSLMLFHTELFIKARKKSSNKVL